ncbi:MAG TPA: hypothetical protein VNL77_07540 [Roseiflexaceae bacterium]|nr:hypothetical protein [Roseiflexaceae bacterium]
MTSDTARFTVSDPALGALSEALLGIWQPEAAAVTFASGGAPPAEGATWTVDLPEDPLAARALVAGRAQGALHAASALRGLEAQVRAAGALPGDSAVFFSGGGPLGWLQQVFTEEARQLDERGGWEEARRQFAAIVESATRGIRFYAAVETAQGGALIARSRVGWGGDTLTAVRAGARQEQLLLHGQSLLLARRSRAVVVQTVLVTVQTAAALATGNPLAIVPAIWRALNTLAARAAAPREGMREGKALPSTTNLSG